MNYYEILQLTKDSTIDEIKKSYRTLALKYHPDRNLGNVDKCTEIFKCISESYSILSDEAARRDYDNKLTLKCSNTVGKFEAKDSNSCQQKQYTSQSQPFEFPSTKFKAYCEPEPVYFSCTVSIQKAHKIFNDFFADFDEFNGDTRNAMLSKENKNYEIMR